MNITASNFGLEVRKKLLDIGMAQMELARQIGISEAYLSEILNDKKEALDIRRKILFIINTEESRCVVNKK